MRPRPDLPPITGGGSGLPVKREEFVMVVSVRLVAGEHRLAGDWAGLEVANGFLDHLRVRTFSPATVRAYAYAFDVANFARFLAEQRLSWPTSHRWTCSRGWTGRAYGHRVPVRRWCALLLAGWHLPPSTGAWPRSGRSSSSSRSAGPCRPTRSRLTATRPGPAPDLTRHARPPRPRAGARRRTADPRAAPTARIP